MNAKRPFAHFSLRRSVTGISEVMAASGDLRRNLTALVIFAAAISLPCFVLYRAVHAARAPPLLLGNATTGDDPVPSIGELWPAEPNDSDGKFVNLEKILQGASMDDGTVILTTLNEAWAKPGSIFDLFVESFRLGYHTRRLLSHLVVVALDKKAYYHCLSVHAHCFALASKGVDFSGEKYFMTPDYLKMMWKRIDFLRVVLELGYNFVFTDADVMWFRDPFSHFYADADFQIACDHFVGDPLSLNNMPNGGFSYVKSNNRSIKFYNFWYSSGETYPGRHDQDVLNIIKKHPFIDEIGLKMRFLDTAFFGGLCEPSRDFNKVCTMHANCCCGLGSKIHDLKIMLDDWRRFMSFPLRLKRLRLVSWSVPQNCSL